MTFAIIQTGGKQYKVKEKQKLKIEKVEGEKGSDFVFDKVLLIAEQSGTDADSHGNSDVKIGTPYLEKARVEAKILRQARDKKKIVFKYQSKTRRRNKAGHRQHFTEVEIGRVNF